MTATSLLGGFGHQIELKHLFRPKTLSRLQLLSSKVFLDGFFTAVEGIMKTILLAVLLAMSTAHFAARADVSARLTTDGDGVKEFRLAIGTHFGIKERAITEVRKDIPDSELPVVFHLAGKAKVSPAAIVALRRQKKTWMDITLHFGLSPEVSLAISLAIRIRELLIDVPGLALWQHNEGRAFLRRRRSAARQDIGN